MPTIYFGADHGGFRLKNELIRYLEELGYETIDLGAHELDQGDDYPDVVRILEERLKSHPKNEPIRAVMICGSGIGMCVSTNKLPGLRAIKATSPETAYFGRLHNDINVLCLAGLRSNTSSIERVTDGDYSNLIDAGMNMANSNEAKRIVKVFLETETQATPGSRHRRRLDKIGKLEC